MDAEVIKYYARMIVDKSIEINSYDIGTGIEFKCRHNKIIAGAIKKNLYRFMHEYDDTTILRDQVYTTYYECLIDMIKKERYTQADMEIIVKDINDEQHEITKQFIKTLNVYMDYELKKVLINQSRRDQSGEGFSYIDTTITYDSELLTYLGECESSEEDVTDPEDIWFYKHLSRAEKEFVEQFLAGTLPVYDDPVLDKREKERVKKIKQRIRRKLESMDERLMDKALQKETRMETVVNILNVKNPNRFVMTVKQQMKKNWFSEILIDYVPAEHRRNFNKNNITNDTIKAIRVGLVKYLNDK